MIIINEGLFSDREYIIRDKLIKKYGEEKGNDIFRRARKRDWKNNTFVFNGDSIKDHTYRDKKENEPRKYKHPDNKNILIHRAVGKLGDKEQIAINNFKKNYGGAIEKKENQLTGTSHYSTAVFDTDSEFKIGKAIRRHRELEKKNARKAVNAQARKERIAAERARENTSTPVTGSVTKTAAQTKGNSGPAGVAQKTATTINNHNSSSASNEPYIRPTTASNTYWNPFEDPDHPLAKAERAAARQKDIERLKANIAAAAEPQVHTDAIEAHKGTSMASANKGLGKESTADFANNSKTAAQTKGNSGPAGGNQSQAHTANNHNSGGTATPAPEKKDSGTIKAPQSSEKPITQNQASETGRSTTNSSGQKSIDSQASGNKTKPQSNSQPPTKKDTITGSGKKGGSNTPPPPNNPNKPGMLSRGVDFVKAHKKPLIGAGVIGAGIGAAYLYNRHKKKKEEEKKRLAAEAEARRLANRTPLERARDSIKKLKDRYTNK